MLSDNFNPLFSRPRYFVNSSSVIFQSVKLQFSPVFLFRYFHIAPPSTPLRQSVAAISRLICRSADVDCISPMNFALSQLTVSRKLAEVRRESRNRRTHTGGFRRLHNSKIRPPTAGSLWKINGKGGHNRPQNGRKCGFFSHVTDSSCGPDQGPVQCALSRNVTSGKTEKLKSKKTETNINWFW